MAKEGERNNQRLNTKQILIYVMISAIIFFVGTSGYLLGSNLSSETIDVQGETQKILHPLDTIINELDEIKYALSDMNNELRKMDSNFDDQLASVFHNLSDINSELHKIDSNFDNQLASVFDNLSVLEEDLQAHVMAQEIEPTETEIKQSLNNEAFTRINLISGDTVWDLARRYQSPPTEDLINRIISLNDISDPTKLRIGQSILLPSNASD